MLHKNSLIPRFLLVLTAVFLLSLPAVAEDPDVDEDKIVVRSGGHHLTVDKDGDVLRIVSLEDGDEQIVELNLSEVGVMVNDAMADMGDMLAELDDLQMSFNLGEDNRLSLAHDDAHWELDLDEIMAQVGVALEGMGDEFDMGEWTHNSRRHHFETSDDDLKDELKALRDEVRDLRRELDKVREK